MNPKHLKLIAVLLGVAVLLYLLPRLFGSDEGRGSVRVADGFSFSLADPVTRIDIIHREEGDTIRLDRTPAGWTVDGYVADSAKVADLLEVLPELSSDEMIARNPANHPSLGVSDEAGRRIEVYTEAGGPLAFYLGDRDLAAGGYYVREPGEDLVFRLEGPAGGYLGRDRDGWRDRSLAAVDTAGVREILVRRGERETVLRRTEEGWLADGAPADTAAVQGLLRLLPGLSVSGYPTEEEAAAADFSSPDAELDIFSESEGDVTGRQLVLALRFVEDEEGGDWLVRPADGAEVYRLADFTVRRLVPEDLIP